MQSLILRQRYSRNPTGRTQFTGSYDENGEPIVRALPERFLPGSIVKPVDEAELEFLISNRVARPLTSMEEALFEKGQMSGFAVDPVDA